MKQLILLLLLPLLALPLVYAQVFEGTTADNSTNYPSMDIHSISWNQGALLTIIGSNLSPSADVDVTIYHPNNSKFGIFTAKSTNAGDFQIPVEIAKTSIQGEYTIKALVNGTNLIKKFVYSGADNITVSEIIPVVEEPLPITNSTNTNSTTPEPIPEPIESAPSTSTDWDKFILDLNTSDRLDLINAIVRYLLS